MATTLTINIDNGNHDPGGTLLTIPASADIDAAGAFFNGNTDNDTFNIAPDGDGPGGDSTRRSRSMATIPRCPGDVLNLDITGLTSPNLTVDWRQRRRVDLQQRGRRDLHQHREVNVSRPATCYGLMLDMNRPLGGLNGRRPTDHRLRSWSEPGGAASTAAPVFSGPTWPRSTTSRSWARAMPTRW